ncbi:trifunctional purine biosynthetic protein adenosine-3 [Geobacter sp. OR-1]|uniref:phosphoribosylglycinamide formyltransferase n=1 Tax=Geobacter sp. OR-1 TaxID=1266765 RepID=UPI000541C03A|nr:phosphoribosylglycinamide formyltransferase [Geobacter sp. OR-1]GAM11548.1 trifunctional purine biosynthetic protein adenosine-3 [Geobacter sp. OR-1]
MSDNGLVNLGVLVSGNGTNLQAIIDRIEAGALSARVACVISNKGDARALQRAEKHGIPAIHLPYKGFDGREAYDAELVRILKDHGVELVVLAGFMRILTPVIINAFSNRIMNIHPALLPAFPGLDAQKQALDYGVKVSGCTVHFVDAGCDTGPIIIQAVVPVLEDDTEDTLSQRIHKEEHRIYPEAIRLYSEGKLKVAGRRVVVG